jgi:putative ABC transport system permease protein
MHLDPADEAAIVEELAQHLEASHAELMARGTREDEARELLRAPLTTEALLALRRRGAPRGTPIPPGGPLRGHWFRDLRDDLRYALRTLRKSPAFSIIAVFTLALGIGATTAMYSVVDAVLVRALPFYEPERLVRLLRLRPAESGGRQGTLSWADFLAAREGSQSFASIATYSIFDDGLTYVGGDRPERVYGASVSGDFFRVLGVTPIFGRAFTREDEVESAPGEALISYDFWQRRLGGARDVVGRSITLQGRQVSIVGVMPAGFWFPRGDRAEFWLNNRITTPTCECTFTKRVIARLKPGVSLTQMQTELDRAAAAVRAQFPGGPADWTIIAPRLRDVMVTDVKPVLLLLMAACVFVLLIACVNVTNLVLTRATSREGELAVRVALGASGGRLARQLVVETGVVALIGAVAGAVGARWGVSSLLTLMPNSAPIVHDAGVAVNGRVLLLTAGCALFCALVVGLVPAFMAARSDASRAMQESGRGGSDGHRRRRLRDALVVAEFAISLILVIGGALMTRSLAKLRHVDVGVRKEGVLTASVGLPGARYQSSAAIVSFGERVLARLGALPGVEHAAISTGLPPDRVGDASNFKPEALPLAPGKWEPIGDHLYVTGEYFAAMGIPLREGRVFDARDRDTVNMPLIVNETLAKRYFAGVDPIGQRVRVNGDTWLTVVGVVADVKYRGLADETRLNLYEAFNVFPQWSFSIVMRTSGDPLALTTPLRRAVAAIDPEIAVAQVRTVRDLVDESTAATRFRALLLGVLGAAALILAAVGIYGVMSYAVSCRTREIGVRVALGAQPGNVMTLVLREGLLRATLGVAIGLGGAWALTRLLNRLLYGVTATDPWTFSVVPLVLIAVAAVACWLPARRATRVDPMIALRAD